MHVSPLTFLNYSFLHLSRTSSRWSEREQNTDIYKRKGDALKRGNYTGIKVQTTGNCTEVDWVYMNEWLIERGIRQIGNSVWSHMASDTHDL